MRSRVWASALLAVSLLGGAGAFSTPAYAADGVDLQVGVGDVTFGAGSSVVLHSFTVTNAGTVGATGVTATIDLLSDTPTPALTFPPQINGCTLVNPAELRCPLADIAAGANQTQDFVAKAIEANPVPGSFAPVPMTMKVKVTVTADQADLNPADNGLTSGAVLRTVKSGPTDLVAAAQPIDLHGAVVGDQVAVDLGFINRGPGGGLQGEIVSVFTAPAGTQWQVGAFFSGCAPIVPNITYRCTNDGSNPPDTQDPIQLHPFLLTITGPKIGVGEFSVEGMGGELKPADNVAKIVVAGSSPTATTTPATTPTGNRPSAAPLPTTGTRIGLIVGLGAAALLLGVGLVLLARRRRLEARL